MTEKAVRGHRRGQRQGLELDIYVLMSSGDYDDPMEMMAVEATEVGATEVEVAARLFQGLSDPTRLSILLALLDGELPVRSIVEAVGTSQPNVSNHLACLKGCGLVVDRPGKRRQVFYAIAQPEVVDLLRASERLLSENGQSVRLCDSPMMGER